MDASEMEPSSVENNEDLRYPGLTIFDFLEAQDDRGLEIYGF